LGLAIAISDARAALEQNRQAAAKLEQENAALTEDIGELGTIASIKDLAQRFLGLFDPDTIIFSPED
jgi:cell division protein FtsB